MNTTSPLHLVPSPKPDLAPMISEIQSLAIDLADIVVSLLEKANADADQADDAREVALDLVRSIRHLEREIGGAR